MAEIETSTPPPALAVRESVVSWPAIFAGAVVAVAVGLLLTLLAAGFGLSVSFPGLSTQASLQAFTPELGAAAIVIQVICGGLAGYIAGRLRTVWLHAHGDEAHFRDTAHGLVAWALATLTGVILAATVLGPYAERLAGDLAPVAPPAGPGAARRPHRRPGRVLHGRRHAAQRLRRRRRRAPGRAADRGDARAVPPALRCRGSGVRSE